MTDKLELKAGELTDFGNLLLGGQWEYIGDFGAVSSFRINDDRELALVLDFDKESRYKQSCKIGNYYSVRVPLPFRLKTYEEARDESLRRYYSKPKPEPVRFWNES